MSARWPAAVGHAACHLRQLGSLVRYTTVVSSIARVVGLYEKQSSFFIEAKTAQSIILGNVFFNGPRAGINANGFGGGDEIGHNLVFSSCREPGGRPTRACQSNSAMETVQRLQAE
jgi:hypothetical protein